MYKERKIKKSKKGVEIYKKTAIINYAITFRDSSMVEHSAVNRQVGGSSPLRGAI